ncbi:MAG: hypothetical protein WAN36_02595 [Calditrichia bacterium]
MPPLIGVANSVSANFGYDPVDAIHYASQSGFELIQVYLNAALLMEEKSRDRLRQALTTSEFKNIYFHAEGFFNNTALGNSYSENLFSFVKDWDSPKIIYHFDENAALEDCLKLVRQFSEGGMQLYLENYFQSPGMEAAEKNYRKFMALFSLANNQDFQLHPVLDAPRFFHEKLNMDATIALQWVYQFLNYFTNSRTPILLHLIDATHNHQQISSFAALGAGYLPYEELTGFIKKTGSLLEGIILEYEDKINPLKSREYLLKKLD